MKVLMNREEKLGKDIMIVQDAEEADVACAVPDEGYVDVLYAAAEHELPVVVLAAHDREVLKTALDLGIPEKAIYVHRNGQIMSYGGSTERQYPLVRGGIRVKDLIPLLERSREERWVAEPVVRLIPDVRDDHEWENEELEKLEETYENDADETPDIVSELFGEEAVVYAVIPNAGVDTSRIAAAMAKATSGVRVEASSDKRGPVAGEPYIHFDGNRLSGDQHELAVAETIILEVRMPELIDALLGSKRSHFIFVSGSDFRSHQAAASFIAQWTSVGGRLDAVLLIGDKDDNIAGTIKHRFSDIPVVKGIDNEQDLEEAISELIVPTAV